MAKTLYQLLGVPSTATPEIIKNAYIRIAAQLRSSGAQAQYEVIKQAYDILSDPASRVRYDRQAYVVSEVSPVDTGERHWLLSWRGAAVVLVVLFVAYSSWLYYKREQYRLHLEHERKETARQAEETRREVQARELAEQGKLADERRREEAQRATLERSDNRDRGTALYRETLDHAQTARRERLELQRERDATRREEAERRRVEIEQRQRLLQDKRHLRELEQTRPGPQRF
jgi:curved DNA-binding protein CbpA